MATDRDPMASLKMLGGLLRLDALLGDGFTAQDLVDHADVNWETARGFIRDCSYTEVFVRQKSTGQQAGRPPTVYKLRPGARAAIMHRLAGLRQAADCDVPSAQQSSALFEPLELLEEILGGLEEFSGTSDDWHALLREVRLELRSATADLETLRLKRHYLSDGFARRLGIIEGRLITIERFGPMRQPRLDVVSWLTEEFGSWMKGVPALRNAVGALDRVVVLLDGIVGSDPVATRMYNVCNAASVPVAAFDVGSMNASKRKQLFVGLNALRTATPLAISDFILTVDGRTRAGRDLVSEVREFAQPRWWQSHASENGTTTSHSSLTEGDLISTRRYYVERGTRIVGTTDLAGDTSKALHTAATLRVVSALSALDAISTLSIAIGPQIVGNKIPATYEHSSFLRPEHEGYRWHNAAKALLGEIVCVDLQRNGEVQETLGHEGVHYVVNAEISDEDISGFFQDSSHDAKSF